MPRNIVNNHERSRFELTIDGNVVFADYRRDGDRLIIPHVEAALVLRGTGAASELMNGIMEIAKAEGLKVVPLCGYASAWMRRHR